MNISKITSSFAPMKNTLGKGVNKLADKIGGFVCDNNTAKTERVMGTTLI